MEMVPWLINRYIYLLSYIRRIQGGEQSCRIRGYSFLQEMHLLFSSIFYLFINYFLKCFRKHKNAFWKGMYDIFA